MESHNDIRRNIPSIWYRNQKNVVDKIYKDWNMKQYSEEEIHTICGILEVCYSFPNVLAFSTTEFQSFIMFRFIINMRQKMII